MESTRLSLLAQATSGSQRAWTQLVELYQPLVYGWLRRHDVAHHDAEELTQDVIAAVVRELPVFAHCGRPGAFRNWLRLITANRARGFWRAGKFRPAATGQSHFLKMVEAIEDDSSSLSRIWDREHDQHVLRQLLAQLDDQFEPATLTAFRRQVFDSAPAEQVASETGMSVGAVYSAKSRVLRKLRAAAEDLVDTAVFE